MTLLINAAFYAMAIYGTIASIRAGNDALAAIIIGLAVAVHSAGGDDAPAT